MIRGIVFDFDMTLVDSAAGICANLNALAAEKNLRPLRVEEVRPTIGWALVDAMRHFWGNGSAEEEWLPRYRALFIERDYAGVSAFSQTVPALEYFKALGVPLAIATNRLAPEGIVRAARLESYFKAIVGIENFAPKPDPAIVLEAVSRLGLRPEEAMYVGDTDIDMRTAHNAAVLPVAVATGNHSEAALSESGAAHVLTDLSYLPELWEALHEKV